jgi:hypothetical protein
VISFNYFVTILLFWAICRAADVIVTAKKGRLDPIFQRHFDTNFPRGIKQEYDKDLQEVRIDLID